jgi:hypothetical protein
MRSSARFFACVCLFVYVCAVSAQTSGERSNKGLATALAGKQLQQSLAQCLPQASALGSLRPSTHERYRLIRVSGSIYRCEQLARSSGGDETVVRSMLIDLRQ